MAKPKVIGRADLTPDYAMAAKFLDSTGLWDSLSHDEREAFCRRGEIHDSVAGNKLARLIAQRSGESYIKAKYLPKEKA